MSKRDLKTVTEDVARKLQQQKHIPRALIRELLVKHEGHLNDVTDVFGLMKDREAYFEADASYLSGYIDAVEENADYDLAIAGDHVRALENEVQVFRIKRFNENLAEFKRSAESVSEPESSYKRDALYWAALALISAGVAISLHFLR